MFVTAPRLWITFIKVKGGRGGALRWFEGGFSPPSGRGFLS